MASKGSKKASLHSLSRLPINLETFFKELEGESDRACALVAGSAISEELADLLTKYFVNLNESDINHLFHAGGAPLIDFATRIDIAFALGLISPQERLVANAIRKIRNVFAHTLAQIDFSHELIAAELSNISYGELLLDMKDMKELKALKPKALFIQVSLRFYLALGKRVTYLLERETSRATGLGGASVPIYELSKKTVK
jgi:hypothetical protein